MSVLTNFKRNFDAWLVAKSAPFWQAWLRGGEADAGGGGATLVNGYQQSVWVYACVNAVASQIANTPFCVTQGRGQGERKLERGPLFELFRQPHPQCSRFEFWELLLSWLQIRGEAFAVPLTLANEVVDLASAGGRGAKPQQFALLDAACFRHDVVGGHLLGWFYTSGDTKGQMDTRYFLLGEVIHIRRPNPFDFWRGLSPLAVAHLAASADYASAQFHKGLMLNNADTGIVVTTEQQPSPEQREAMLAALRERKRRAGTADRPLFLWGGAKVEKPSVSSADLQFLENRKFNRQEICAVFGVPQEVLGFTEDANRSVGESARLNFIENTCMPLGERLEAAFENVVRGFGPELYGYFDFDSLPVMQAARRQRADVAVKYFGMGVPLADLNETFDLGLPDRPWHAKGYVPFSFQEAGADSAQPPASPAGGPATPAEDTTGAASLRKALALLERTPAAKAKPPAHQPHTCAASADYEASIAGSVRNKVGKLGKFFNVGQRGRVLAKLEQKRSVIGGQRSAAQGRALSDDIFDEAAENVLLKGVLAPLAKMDLEFGGAQLWQEFGLGDFTLPPQKAIDYLNKRGTRWEEINGLTHTNLRETLADGLANGDSFDQLADRVRAVFNEAGDTRAETIALTETNTAVNAGRFEGLVESGIARKGWLSANLENSRPAHQQAGRDYAEGIPVDEDFDIGGEKMKHPGDPNASAGNTINCKCHLIALGQKTIRPAGSKLLSWTEYQAARKP